MKNTLTLIALLVTSLLFSQSGINYKAVIKDGTGTIVSNQVVIVQFAIKEITSVGTTVYEETHSPSTDINGLVILNIGEGTPITGTFSTIDWGSDAHFLNVQVNAGSGLTDMGTSQFKTVPYALHAANVKGLEALDEGNGIGHRIIGRNLNNLGDIGLNAVDLSGSPIASATYGATGEYSVAMNRQTTAQGDFSTAMGLDSKAYGATSTVMGFNTVANGYDSAAMGAYTVADASQSLAIGRYNIGGGNNQNWNPMEPIFEIGIGSGPSAKANALTVLKNGTITAPSLTNALIDTAGDRALITKDYAITYFYPTGLQYSTVYGGWRLYGNSDSVGNSAIDLSFKFSINATGATGAGSFATGENVSASGWLSKAMGRFAVASGESSTSIGSHSTASGYNSLATGHVTFARSYGETAMGINCTDYIPSSTFEFFNTDRLFVIGNGLATAKSDALIVLKNGTITAPSLTNSLIDIAGDKALITKEYIDDIIDNDVNDLYVGYDAGRLYNGNSLYNVGVGSRALEFNTAGQYNTAVGQNALQKNKTNSNTAIGSYALENNINGYENTAVGRSAMGANSYGNANTAVGYSALSALISGSNNIAIGHGVQVVNNNSSNQIRIGNSAITYASIQVPWTVTSDKRWKDQIRDLPYGLNMVSELRPVDYIRKSNEAEAREVGFIAQEVQLLLKDLGYYDQGMLTEADDGSLSLRYNDFIPILVKAIQQQQGMINSQKAEIGNLSEEISQIQQLTRRINQLEANQKNVQK